MRHFLFAAAFAVLLTPSAARADDITFTVPMRVENLQQAPMMTVGCFVYGVDAHGMPRTIGPFRSVDVPLVAGSYHGNVRIVIDLYTGERRDSARTWQCSMSYFARDSRGSAVVVAGNNDADRNSEYTRVTGQNISSSHLFVSGTFPAH